jgi:flavin reductase (DIM6/NTAB) family NADH-FMN oxidoreductase RutF
MSQVTHPLVSAPATVNPTELRKAFGGFVTGVTVVTALDEHGVPRGLTANSFTSVSMNPPLVLVCIDKKASSHLVFSQTAAFAVSVLSASQRHVSNLFASKAADKFDHCETFAAATGTPLIRDAVCWFDCTVHKHIDAGDHLLVLGEVKAFHHTTGTPLAYCRGNYIDFGLEQEAVGTGRNLVYGAIADRNGKVLLDRDPLSGKWSIPLSRRVDAEHLRPEHAPGGLPKALDALGVKANLSFLYSVFEEGAETMIVYRGVVPEESGETSVPPKRASFFSSEDLPWDAVATSQMRTMLRRYFVERGDDRFGIYMDSEAGGSVAMLDGSPTPWAQHAQKLDTSC